MPTTYPNALDNFGVPTAGETLGGSTPNQVQMVTNLRDAVQAIEAELGLAPSGSFATVLARLESLVASGGIPPAAYDAKGDLLVGTGPDAYIRLATSGTDGVSVLTKDSTLTAGVKWASPATGATGTAIPSGWTAPDAGVNDGLANATPAIQAVIDASKRVYLPPGTYRCTSELQADSGTMIWGPRGSVLQRDYQDGGGSTGALITNRDWTGGSGRNGAVEVDNVWVGGDGVIEAKAQVRRGNVNGGSISSGSPTLTVTGAAFIADDVGTGVLVPGAAAAGGDLKATITARTSATVVTLNVNAGTTVSGVNVDTIAYGGIIGLMGNRIVLRDFFTTYWQGGRHTVLAGDYCRAYNTKWYGGGGAVGNGGFRFVGGKQFQGIGLHCESGDDSFQFVPVDPGVDPMRDLTIQGSAYIGCTGNSSDAKFMVFGLQDGGTTGEADGKITMSASILNSGFSNCHGSSTSLAFLAQNISSSGALRNCYITDCSVDMAGAGATGSVHSNINAFESSGGCHGFTVRNLEIKNPTRHIFYMQRGGQDTTIDGLKSSRPAGETLPLVKLAGKNTKFLNSVIDNGASNVSAVVVEMPEPEPQTGPGAGGTGVRANDGTMTNGSAILTSATANFLTGDVGADIVVEGAGAAGTFLLNTSIASRQSATQVTLATTAKRTTGGTGIIYTYTTPGPVPSNVTIDGNRLHRLGAASGNAYGITATVGDGITVDGNLFQQNGASTVVRALNVAAACTNVQIGERNNWRTLLAAVKNTVATGAGVTYLGNGVSTATTAQLASVTATVNTSAKVTGRQVFNSTTGRPVWASGALTTSVWRFHDGTTAHTPV